MPKSANKAASWAPAWPYWGPNQTRRLECYLLTPLPSVRSRAAWFWMRSEAEAERDLWRFCEFKLEPEGFPWSMSIVKFSWLQNLNAWLVAEEVLKRQDHKSIRFDSRRADHISGAGDSPSIHKIATLSRWCKSTLTFSKTTMFG